MISPPAPPRADAGRYIFEHSESLGLVLILAGKGYRRQNLLVWNCWQLQRRPSYPLWSENVELATQSEKGTAVRR